MTTTKAARVRLLHHEVRREAFAEASRFRGEFYECLTARRDELFELADAVLCADGAVKSPVDLTLPPEHRRGYGAMYGGLNHGRIDRLVGGVGHPPGQEDAQAAGAAARTAAHLRDPPLRAKNGRRTAGAVPSRREDDPGAGRPPGGTPCSPPSTPQRSPSSCAAPSPATTSWPKPAGTRWRPWAATPSRPVWTTTSPTRPWPATPASSPLPGPAASPRPPASSRTPPASPGPTGGGAPTPTANHPGSRAGTSGHGSSASPCGTRSATPAPRAGRRPGAAGRRSPRPSTGRDA